MGSKNSKSTAATKAVRRSKHKPLTDRPRTLQEIDRDLEAFRARMRKAKFPAFEKFYPELESLKQERAKHPETVGRSLGAFRLGPQGGKCDSHELGGILNEIASDLHAIETCVWSAYLALNCAETDMIDVRRIAHALLKGAAEPLVDKPDELYEAVKNARFQDGRMVVVEEESAKKATS